MKLSAMYQMLMKHSIFKCKVEYRFFIVSFYIIYINPAKPKFVQDICTFYIGFCLSYGSVRSEIDGRFPVCVT